MMDMSLEWSCHVCGKTRPDEEIGVVSRTRDLGEGIEMKQNLRYCLVDAHCIDEAVRWASTRPVPPNWREPLEPV